MQTSKTLWTFLLIGLLAPLIEGLVCGSSNECFCYHGDEYEYQCPSSGDMKYTVFIKPQQKTIRMECSNSVTEFDTSFMPKNISLGEIELFTLQFCPLPKTNFKQTMAKFNITLIKEMDLEQQLGNDVVYNVSKELFDGLEMLQILYVSLAKANFESDSFANLYDLLELSLNNNAIEQIDHNMFQHTTNLRQLDLSRNLITHLPDGLFKNLSDLRLLHLWTNKLTSLSKHTFSGLSELKSLELSNNKIEYLDEDAFSELLELVNISLRSNNLNIMTSRIFRNNNALKGVRLGLNPNLNMSDYVFANLINLTNVNIDSSNLEDLPEHTFEGSVNLQVISLKNNNIKHLPDILFKDLTKLIKLDLSGNKLRSLPNEIFRSLRSLQELNLNKNNLIEINDIVFRNTLNLRVLNLNNNNISIIDLGAFGGLHDLQDLDLSYNRYNLSYGTVVGFNPFQNCEDLQNLKLSHNLIYSFPENIIENKVKLKSLDLEYNQIESLRVAALIKVSDYQVEVHLNNNNISILDFIELKKYAEANVGAHDAMHSQDSSTVVYMSQNPIECDCSNFEFIQYNNDKLNPVIKTVVNIRMDDLYCATPSAFSHILVKELKPENIRCPLRDNAGCPSSCFCEYRPYDKCAIVNCDNRNLTEPPLMHLVTKGLDNIEVHLEKNALKSAPYSGLGYEDVTRLYLSNNYIRNLSWIPPKVEELTLNGNKLKNLDTNVIYALNKSTTLKHLTLYGNPWHCDCSSISLQNYLKKHYKVVTENDVVCEDQKLLTSKTEICKSHTAIAMAIAMPILAILCATAVVAALYFYYQEEIKVWLYAKNLCLWFVTEEELDKDKIYDIFISYSYKDEEFVIQNLLPVLESGPNPFKICIHVRDWVPGEFIATQVTKSVLDSRRTLVVLSENFLESVWGKMEFRTAHTQAINEGRARVVVIKYGKLDEEKLDDELKTYLKTNTYVEWGDPWFWNKLKYALPHSAKNKLYKNRQKHANIMLKIDDKFELVTSSPTVHMESTPPVMSLDPSLLKHHPLNFNNSSNNIATPPAEAPLMVRK